MELGSRGGQSAIRRCRAAPSVERGGRRTTWFAVSLRLPPGGRSLSSAVSSEEVGAVAAAWAGAAVLAVLSFMTIYVWRLSQVLCFDDDYSTSRLIRCLKVTPLNISFRDRSTPSECPRPAASGTMPALQRTPGRSAPGRPERFRGPSRQVLCFDHAYSTSRLIRWLKITPLHISFRDRSTPSECPRRAASGTMPALQRTPGRSAPV